MGREHSQNKGWHVVAELTEDERGASGASFDLPQLNTALEMARAGEFDVLVTRELDRLARGIAKQLIIEEEFKRNGVKVEYVLGDYPNTPEGALMKNVRAVIAEYERLKTIERTIRGRRREVKEGSTLVGHLVPYGYDKVQKDNKYILVIREDEAKIVRMVYDWFVHDHVTVTAIAEKLTEMGAPTWHDNRKGAGYKIRRRGQWQRSSVYYILRSETYAGTWYYGKANKRKGTRNGRDHWIAVTVPAIISRKQWEEAQRRLDSNRYLNPRINRKYEYLLSRRLFCGCCGSKMQSTTSHKISYYRCEASVRRKAVRKLKTCNMRSFRVDKVDPAIWKWLKSVLCDPAEMERGLAAYRTEQEKQHEPLRQRLDTVKDLLTEYQGQLDRLLDLYLSGNIQKNMLLERKQSLEGIIQALESEEANIRGILKAEILTQERLQTIWWFADKVGTKLADSDDNFALQRGIVDALDMTATLVVEDGEQLAYVRCALGEETLRIQGSIMDGERPRCSRGRAGRE
jgi:site-specific DNA recombinase